MKNQKRDRSARMGGSVEGFKIEFRDFTHLEKIIHGSNMLKICLGSWIWYRFTSAQADFLCSVAPGVSRNAKDSEDFAQPLDNFASALSYRVSP